MGEVKKMQAAGEEALMRDVQYENKRDVKLSLFSSSLRLSGELPLVKLHDESCSILDSPPLTLKINFLS